MDRAAGFSSSGQLIYGSAAPSFLEQEFFSWVYMDDFASFSLAESGPESLQRLRQQRQEVGRLLRAQGFAMHKDGESEGFPEALGATVSAGRHRLQPIVAKLALLVGPRSTS